MKKFMKQWMTLALAVMMLVTAVPMGNVEAKAKKLGKKDFQYTVDGKKHNFLTEAKEYEAIDACLYEYPDTRNGKSKKYCKGTVNTVKTKRNIKWGSTETAVMKQYGKTKKKKVSKTERYFKYIKYAWYTIDTSAWKNYLEYNYKQGKDNYKIRFYLDKKDTVTAITYIKNLNKFYNYPNKERKSGLSFKAPSGKKITTKTIGGKKVYIIPKGTKIYMNQKKANVSYSDFIICQYDMKEKIIAHSDLLGLGVIGGVKYGFQSIEEHLRWVYPWDAEKDEPVGQKPINIKKLGSYRYFAIYCFSVSSEDELAPQIIYFRYKK